MNKILVASPINSVKHYILPNWLNYIRTLTYPDYDIYLVDNSADPGYHKKIQSMGFDVDYIKPKGEPRENICRSQNLIRQKALNNPIYSHLMFIECDVFAPKNVIQALLFYEKEVVSIPYFKDIGKDSKVMLQGFKRGKNNTQMLAYNYSLLAGFLKMTGNLIPIFANGLGCTLIKREILEKIEFTIEKTNDSPSDVCFYRDLDYKNITNYVDTSVLAYHYNKVHN